MSSYTVLESRPLPDGGPGTCKAEIILCKLEDDPCSKYATWQRNVETGGRYWGHYFKTLSEAAKDFEARSRP